MNNAEKLLEQIAKVDIWAQSKHPYPKQRRIGVQMSKNDHDGSWDILASAREIKLFFPVRRNRGLWKEDGPRDSHIGSQVLRLIIMKEQNTLHIS